MTQRKPKPPDHLSPAAAAWWSTVCRDYQLEPHHLHLLRLACDALDRAEQAREVLQRDGITTFDDRKNVRPQTPLQGLLTRLPFPDQDTDTRAAHAGLAVSLSRVWVPGYMRARSITVRLSRLFALLIPPQISWE
jgi:hypothetical protein